MSHSPPETGKQEANPKGLLDRIVAVKKTEIAALPDSFALEAAPRPRSFAGVLLRKPGEKIKVISECKKASPSMGLMRPEYDPGAIAREYAEMGAAAISCLTDHDFFQGQAADLTAARACGLPVLRKDFTLVPAQVYEARALGADAILLIVRLLDDSTLKELLELAESLGMDVLVEIHDEPELDRALKAGAKIIGINHRNLDTLEMDLTYTPRLAPRIRRERPDAIIVAESGVESPEGRASVDEFADAILIGTAFMKSGNITETWQKIFS